MLLPTWRCDTEPSEPLRKTDMRDIIPGLVVLAIGLFTGSSMFLGNFSLGAVFFDLFGLFFIGRGLFKLYSARAR